MAIVIGGVAMLGVVLYSLAAAVFSTLALLLRGAVHVLRRI